MLRREVARLTNVVGDVIEFFRGDTFGRMAFNIQVVLHQFPITLARRDKGFQKSGIWVRTPFPLSGRSKLLGRRGLAGGAQFPADQAGSLFGANCDWLYKPVEVARWKAEMMNWFAKQTR